jgi:hypothetical protein
MSQIIFSSIRMGDESKDDPSFDDIEYRVKFNTDEGYREVRGVDMSTTGPGPGNQRAVLEGEYGGVRNRLLRGEIAPEQTFRSTVLNYLKGAYPGLESRQHQNIIDQALEIPNYQNLFPKLLVAAIYFRQRTPLLRNRQGLTAELLDEHAGVVLRPLLDDVDARRVRPKKLTREVYFIQLKADLLRYLRYILPK